MLRRLRKWLLGSSVGSNIPNGTAAGAGEEKDRGIEGISSSQDGDRQEIQDGDKKEARKRSVTFFQLFKYTNRGERLLLTVAMAAALCTGASLPLFAFVSFD